MEIYLYLSLYASKADDSVKYVLNKNQTTPKTGEIPISLPVLSTEPTNYNTCKNLLAVDRAYREPHQLGRQAITIVPAWSKAVLHGRRPRHAVPVPSTAHVRILVFNTPVHNEQTINDILRACLF